MKTDDFLNTPLYALGLRIEFCDQCKRMGFETIGAVVGTPPNVIVAMDGFSYHWLAELSELLNKEGLLHLLQPGQGSIHD